MTIKVGEKVPAVSLPASTGKLFVVFNNLRNGRKCMHPCFNVLEPDGIPAGIVVSLIGAPYFIYLLLVVKDSVFGLRWHWHKKQILSF